MFEYKVEQRDNPKKHTPSIYSEAFGYMSWGGRRAKELNAKDVVMLLEFCKEEGSRQGWNDEALHCKPKRKRENERGPFHPKLLGGFPFEEWKRSYLRGVDEYCQHLEEME
jgi:hypothetical protein